MTLGRFGGTAPKILRTPAGGSVAQGDLLDQARQRLIPSPEGMPALSQQLAQYLAGFGINLLINGGVESFSAGTTSAPDGWTLSGAGATIARNTTSGQIQEGLASCNVTAALNTVTRLSQTISVSATQNTRLRGRDVVLSARVLASTAARVSVELDDGVATAITSLAHTGSGLFETLAVTITLDAAATQVKVSLLISSGASMTATIDAIKLEEGATATAFTPNANDTFVQPRVLSAGNAVTTSSTTLVDIGSGLQVANVILNGNQTVLLIVTLDASNNTANTTHFYQFLRDSTQIGATDMAQFFHTASDARGATFAFLDVKPAAGNYTYKLQWRLSSGATVGTISNRVLAVAVIPSA